MFFFVYSPSKMWFRQIGHYLAHEHDIFAAVVHGQVRLQIAAIYSNRADSERRKKLACTQGFYELRLTQLVLANMNCNEACLVLLMRTSLCVNEPVSR